MKITNKWQALMLAGATALIFPTDSRADVGDVSRWVGHGVAYDAETVEVKTPYLIEIIAIEVSASQIDRTTKNVFPNGMVRETHCITTHSDNGKAVIQCDDSFGESILIGNMIQRVLHKNDGTTIRTTVVISANDTHREVLRTRFSSEGDALGYSREALDLIEN